METTDLSNLCVDFCVCGFVYLHGLHFYCMCTPTHAGSTDSSRLWSLIEKVSPHKKKENAFDKRTTDSSAQQYFQVN